MTLDRFLNIISKLRLQFCVCLYLVRIDWIKFTYGVMGLNIKKNTNAHNMHNYRLKCTYFLYINGLGSFDKNRQFLSKYA